MRIDLLAALQRHLEKLEATKPTKRKRRFDIDTFYKRGTKSCGTAACALGEACFVPELRAEGLRLTHDVGSYMVPVFKGEWVGFDAAMKLFGLSSDEAHDLFGIDSYWPRRLATPGNVAKRIAELIEDNTP